MRGIVYLPVLLLFMLAKPALASLIERDYAGITNGITFDSETNYEWLDLSFTRTMNLTEYQNYLLELDDGWKFASSDMVSVLLTNFGLISVDNSAYGTVASGSGYSYYSSPELAYIELVDDLAILGESMSMGSNFYGIKGFTSDQLGATYEQYMAYYSKSKSIGIVSLGDYIRIPSGKSIQSFFTYREAQVQPQAVDLPEPSTISIFILMACILGLTKRRRF